MQGSVRGPIEAPRKPHENPRFLVSSTVDVALAPYISSPRNKAQAPTAVPKPSRRALEIYTSNSAYINVESKP